MNREVENFLASHPYAKSTKESYVRVLDQLLTIPNLEQLDAAGLVQFIDKPGWGNSQGLDVGPIPAQGIYCLFGCKGASAL